MLITVNFQPVLVARSWRYRNSQSRWLFRKATTPRNNKWMDLVCVRNLDFGQTLWRSFARNKSGSMKNSSELNIFFVQSGSRAENVRRRSHWKLSHLTDRRIRRLFDRNKASRLQARHLRDWLRWDSAEDSSRRVGIEAEKSSSPSSILSKQFNWLSSHCNIRPRAQVLSNVSWR